eukprot:ANDGO_02530.mRNA.1 hypothetical protein AMSG_03988
MTNTSNYHFSVPLIGKIFLTVILLECFVVCGTTIAVLASTPSHASTYYCILVLLTIIFLGYFGIDAVVQENSYQLVAFLLTTVLLTSRVVYSYVFARSDSNNKNLTEVDQSLVFAAMIVACVCQVLYIPIGYKVYQSFGWKTFKRVGASSGIISMFKAYQIFLSIIKVDIQFCIVVTLMAGFFLDYHWAFGVIVSGLFVTLVFSYVVIDFGIKQERSGIVLAYLLFSLFAPAYIVYKLIMIYEDEDLIKNVDNGDSKDTTRYLLTISAVCALICRIGCMSTCIFCYTNFGKSLKEIVFDKEHSLIEKLIHHSPEHSALQPQGSTI